MTPAAINTVLSLSSAIHDLAQASEKVELGVRHKVGATIALLLQVIDDKTGLPAVVAGIDPVVMTAFDPAGARLDCTVSVVARGPEVQSVHHHADESAGLSDPAPEAPAADVDAELTTLMAVVNAREDAIVVAEEQVEPLRAANIPQSLRIALRDHGIVTIEQLTALTWRDLSDLKGVGLAGASIVRRRLLTAGHSLATPQASMDDPAPAEQNVCTSDLGIHPELIYRLESLRIFNLDDLCRVGRAVLEEDLVIGDLGAACLAQKARNFGRELAA